MKQYDFKLFSVLDCECGEYTLGLKLFRKNRTIKCAGCDLRYALQ